MPDQIPKPFLPATAIPWAKAIEKRGEQQAAEIADLKALVTSQSKALAQALAALGAVSEFDPAGLSIDMSQVPTGNLAQSRVTGTWDKPVSAVGSVAATGDMVATGTGSFAFGVTSVGMYNQSVAGMGGFRTVSVALNGVTGGLTSSERYKTDIIPAEVPLEALRALRVVFYRYLAQVPFSQDAEPVNLGLIAEQVDELGFTWLVDYDDEGRPDALNERMLPYVAILLAQIAHDRLDGVERASIPPKE